MIRSTVNRDEDGNVTTVVYYRNCGDWDLVTEWRGGKLQVTEDYSPEHLRGAPLKPCTQEEHKKDNRLQS